MSPVARTTFPTPSWRPPTLPPPPIRRGGLVLFHKLTHHASLPNCSDTIRMSFDLRYQPAGQLTGRPAFPSFVVRSRAAPESVLMDADAWAGMWGAARDAILHGAVTGPIYETARWTKGE